MLLSVNCDVDMNHREIVFHRSILHGGPEFFRFNVNSKQMWNSVRVAPRWIFYWRNKLFWYEIEKSDWNWTTNFIFGFFKIKFSRIIDQFYSLRSAKRCNKIQVFSTICSSSSRSFDVSQGWNSNRDVTRWWITTDFNRTTRFRKIDDQSISIRLTID